MTNYTITATDFALSHQGVHLLRNGFNYKTINFDDIQIATAIKGAETKHVTLSVVFGVLLIIFSVLNAIGVLEGEHGSIYYKSLLISVFPFLGGSYCLYISIKKVPLLVIKNGNQKHKLSLQDIVGSGQKDILDTFLKEKLRGRFDDRLML